MTPETALHLEKARQELDKARAMLGISLSDEAGRAAYLAAFHAAQAYIFERSGRTPKTHSGVRTRFAALGRNEARISQEMRRFLTNAYDLKSLADYAIGPEAVVAPEEATAAIKDAEDFIGCISAMLAGESPE